MKIIKKLVMGICVTAVLAMMTFSVSAMENTSASNNQVSTGTCNSVTIQPYADVIVMKTRVYNGVTQYRRWNETKKCWVDPYWFTLGS